MSSFKDLLGHRKKPHISCDEVGPTEVVEASNVSSTSYLASSEVNTLTMSQHSDVLVVPLPLPSLVDIGDDMTPDCEGEQTDDMSLAQCHPRWQNCQLSMQFRDVLPQPLPTMPLEVYKQLMKPVVPLIISDRPASPVCSVFCTPPNIFGLVRQYFSLKVPSHNLEEFITIADLSFIPGNPEAIKELHTLAASTSDSQYHPYPNCSFFELGGWYRNQGLQKSQGNYAKLLQILSSSSFNTANVHFTCWKKINSQLGINEYNEGEEEWEDKDMGWKRTAITIQVSFSCTTERLGPWLHEVTHLYHCSLVAVLWEKLANIQDDKLFHYEPYQLHWAPLHLDGKVSIYGDLYTSAAFHDAYSNLQESPGKPRCDLPQVIAGLMF